MLVAEVTPENAAYDAITRRSADESIATVDEDGVVTPVAEGTTPIIAMTGDLYASAYVTVVSGSAIAVSGSAIQTGLLQSVGSTIAAELAKGAVAYVGSELMGWGLKESGVGFKDETQVSIDNMNEKLADISDQIKSLETQLNEAVEEIINAIDYSEYDTRVGQMTKLLSNIDSIRKSLNLFIASPDSEKAVLEKKRQLIKQQIEINLLSNEDIIHNQLMGMAGQQSLIKLYSKILKGNKQFLSAKDSAMVQAVYDYFEGMQTNMLELMVEYYHAIGDNGDCINTLIDTYQANIEEQKSLLLPSVPENVVIDKDRNIMVYTGHYYIVIPDHSDPLHIRFKRIPFDGPWYGTIDSENYAYTNMCYKYNHDNWRLITDDELKSWMSASNGSLQTFMQNSLNLSLKSDRQIITMYKFGPDYSSIYYYGYSVYSGDEVSFLYSHNGGETYDDFTTEDCTKYNFYFIVCRTMKPGELGKYFY